jgi:hypothetical protein
MSKKRKVGDSSKAPKILESEEQVLLTPEANTKNPKEHHNKQDELPPQAEATAVEDMGIDANPADNRDPPSPIPSSTSVKPTEETPPEENTDDIGIIGASQGMLEPSNVLAKHTSKEETPLLEKGKSKLELPNYEEFSAEELHAGYLSCLATSRDMEANLVNMTRRKYEVHSIIPCDIYTYVTPKS